MTTKEELLVMKVDELINCRDSIIKKENPDINTECRNCKYSKRCIRCIDVANCDDCINCERCSSCVNSIGCKDCIFCTNCIYCSELNDLTPYKFMIANIEVTEEDFINVSTKIKKELEDIRLAELNKVEPILEEPI